MTCGRAFLRALECFQGVKSLFLHLDRTRLGMIAGAEISRSVEIFREDCEIQVTRHRFE
jgi:hypothetical protein